MKVALEEARKAGSLKEVPVGAVIVSEGNLIAKAHNLVETNRDASAHAELLVIKEASRKLARWRLEGCSLVVTLEPCPMCMTAVSLARIENIFFGTSDPRLGACGSIFDLSCHPGFPHHPKVISGVLETECSSLLKSFFEKLR